MKNKKAQLFTLVAIALIILFFAGYEIYSVSNERVSINKRIETMNSFLFSLEKNIGREVYISGFRTIFLAEDRIAKTGSYIPNMNNFLNDAFLR